MVGDAGDLHLIKRLLCNPAIDAVNPDPNRMTCCERDAGRARVVGPGQKGIQPGCVLAWVHDPPQALLWPSLIHAQANGQVGKDAGRLHWHPYPPAALRSCSPGWSVMRTAWSPTCSVSRPPS